LLAHLYYVRSVFGRVQRHYSRSSGNAILETVLVMPSLHSFILKDPERKLATLWLLKTGVAGGPEYQAG
jgi:hypothetical protein